MTEKRFKKGDFDGYSGRFIPFKREGYSLFDIVDTEKLDFVGFIMPYIDIRDCERDCNIMNVIDYLIKEVLND